jgi:hypothetical protein
MDEKKYNETVERLTKVNKVIAGLDPAIRADAFGLLKGYVTGSGAAVDGGGGGGGGAGGGGGGTPADTSSAEAFVRTQPLDKPSDAVYAIVAWWFSQYGSAPITRENIEALATQIGVTLPNRPDSTLAKAKKDGRGPLPRRHARGVRTHRAARRGLPQEGVQGAEGDEDATDG